MFHWLLFAQAMEQDESSTMLYFIQESYTEEPGNAARGGPGLLVDETSRDSVEVVASHPPSSHLRFISWVTLIESTLLHGISPRDE